MKKITILISLAFLVLFASSCKQEKSLQAYLVESQDKAGFITLDVPTSFLQVKSDDVSEEVKETLKSIRKVNVVALPIKGNEDAYNIEKTILKDIFHNNKDYKNLMAMKVKGMNVSLFYTGETDSIDEVIAFGYGEEVGVGVARLLGEDMEPVKIVEMMDNIKIDGENLNLGQFNAIFKSLNEKQEKAVE